MPRAEREATLGACGFGDRRDPANGHDGRHGCPAGRSTGAGLAARIAVDTIRATPTKVELVRLVAFDEQTYELLRDAAN